MKTDSPLYKLFATYPASFFQIAGLPESEAGSYRFDSIEVKAMSFRIDGVFVPQGGAAGPIQFLEYQFQLDDVIYRRLFGEIFLYLRHAVDDPDWNATVIFPRRSLEPTATRSYRVLLESDKVRRIYLDELDPDQLRLGEAIVQLTVEPEETAPGRFRQVMERAGREIEAVGLRQDIMEAVEQLAMYKFPQLSRKELEEMLGVGDIKQTRVYQEALEEGEERGEIKRAKAIALQMLREGMPISQISRLTYLDPEEIEALSKQEDLS